VCRPILHRSRRLPPSGRSRLSAKDIRRNLGIHEHTPDNLVAVPVCRGATDLRPHDPWGVGFGWATCHSLRPLGCGHVCSSTFLGDESSFRDRHARFGSHPLACRMHPNLDEATAALHCINVLGQRARYQARGPEAVLPEEVNRHASIIDCIEGLCSDPPNKTQQPTGTPSGAGG